MTIQKTIAASLLVSFALGQSSLLGCNEVGCPTAEGTTSSTCTVSNSTLANVGVASYTAAIAGSEPASLSWTLGISVFDGIPNDPDRERLIQRSLYLGTDPSLSLEDATYQGCALVFKNTTNNGPVFYNNNNAVLTVNNTSSDCSLNVGQDCIAALQAQASALATQQDSSCASIARGIESDLPSACPEFHVQGDTSVTGTSLTGPDAPEPLSTTQNVSSNCWPTLPKSNALTPVYAFNVSATAYVNSTGSAVGGVTPLMSVFFGRNESAEPVTNLLCMQPVQVTRAAIVETDEGLGSSVRAPMTAVLAAVLVCAVAQALF